MSGKLAIAGGMKAVTEAVPEWPQVGVEEKQAIQTLMENGKWWMGDKVAEFEKKYAEKHDTAYAVACSNGTTALEMAFEGCGIGAGDEVIVPCYTFIASASAVLTSNAVPIFADILPDSLNVDPVSIEAAITERTKAIVVVHFGGMMCDMDRIMGIARKHNLRVVEDSAHAWGSQWKGKGAGSYGAAGTFSFQHSKNLTAGEGGILITNDKDVADRAWSYHHIGRAREGKWYSHPYLGTNYRMTELQAALLLCQLERLEDHVARREKNAANLAARVTAMPGFRMSPRDPRVTRRAWHLFDLFFVPEAWGSVSRDRFVEGLRAEGVPCVVGYEWPLYKNGVFQNIGQGKKGCPFTCPYRGAEPATYNQLNLPNAERASKTTIWLPHQLLLGNETLIGQVGDAFEKLWENRAVL